MTLQRAGSYVMDWGRELHSQISGWEQENQTSATAGPVKRAASGGADLPERGLKRAKVVDADNVASDETMRKAFEKNEVGKVIILRRISANKMLIESVADYTHHEIMYVLFRPFSSLYIY